jgi:hypothetical protein
LFLVWFAEIIFRTKNFFEMLVKRKSLSAAMRVPSGTQTRLNEKPLGGSTVIMPQAAQGGGVSAIGSAKGKLNFFSVVLDNSAGLVDKTYFIGGQKARLLIDPALNRPDSGSVDPQVMEQVFDVAAVGIGLINLETSSDPQQFQKRFEYYHDVDINGKKPFEPIAMGLAPRNNQFQDLRLTITPSDGGEWSMEWDSGFLIVVMPGEVVTLTCEPASAANR